MKKITLIKKKLIKQNLKNKSIKFVIKKKISSTNDYAKLIKNKAKKWVILSEEQTKGKGRFNRVFYSPKYSGIYLSLVYPLKISTKYANKITPFVGLCVARVIEKICGAEVKIKWINDIILNGKKIGGILCESGFDKTNNLIDYVIIGIGLNVYKNTFNNELKNIATSIENELNITLNRNMLISEILNELDGLENHLKLDFLKEYKEKLNLLGKEVLVSGYKEDFEGKAIDLSNNFELIVIKNGKEIVLPYGDVSLKVL